MGFKKPIDFNTVINQISAAKRELNSSYNDGFIQWEIKKELYQIKFLIDDIIESSGKFTGEEEFLKELSQKKVIDILKR
jgi:phosphoribosylpyrophosphate synthetase